MDWSALLYSAFLLFEEALNVVIFVAVVFTISFIRTKLSEQKLNIIEKIVADGILFAQQVYWHLEGAEKYDKAVEKIVLILKEKKINVSEEQLKVFIESVLKKLKKEFGDQWYE